MADSRPNLVLIVSEDHGPHLGCYGDPNARTPNIDRLAAEGVRFDRHHTTCAICSPGRASILTGLYPHQNGQIHLATHKYAMYRPFSNLATILKSHGYRTARLGKLHVLPEAAMPFDFVWNEPEYISFAKRDVAETARIAHPETLEALTAMHDRICQSHYPDGFGKMPRQRNIQWEYGPWIDPGIPT